MIMVVPFSGGVEIDVPDGRADEYRKRGFAPKAPKAKPKEPEQEPRKARKREQ